MGWTLNTDINTPTHNGAAPTSWTDLDLSSTIGADTYLVLLAVEPTVGVPQDYGFRPNGNSSDLYRPSTTPAGAGSIRVKDLNYTNVVAVFTDSNGVIEWISSGVESTKLYLLGWAAATDYNSDADSPDYSSVTVTAADWADLNLAAKIGSDHNLVMLEYEFVSGFGANFKQAGRPKSYAIDMLNDYNNAYPGGPAVGLANADGNMLACLPTDDSSVLQHKNFSLDKVVNIYVHGYVNDWNRVDSAVGTGVTPPTTFTDLDLSAHVGGAQGVLAYIRVTRGAGGTGTPQRIAFRTNGFSKSTLQTVTSGQTACQMIELDAAESGFFLVPTDSEGVVEWCASTNSYTLNVSVVGYIDPAGPSIDNNSPTGEIYDNTVNLTFDTHSASSDVDEDTIDLTLTRPDAATVDAIVNGVFQTGFAGTITANGTNGFDVVVTTHPPWLVGEWEAEAYCEDVLGNNATLTWTFTSFVYRGFSSIGSPLGLSNEYPLTASHRAQGWLWRDEFYSECLSARRGAVFGGSPAVNRGVVLLGAQYVSYDAQRPPCQVFLSPTQTWVVTFTPLAAHNDGSKRTIIDADQGGSPEFSVVKESTNNLTIRLGAAEITINENDYDDEWVIGTEVTLVVSAENGDVDAWLGSTKILDGDTTEWEARGVDGVFLGVDNGLATGHFVGIIKRVWFGSQRVASLEDVPWL